MKDLRIMWRFGWAARLDSLGHLLRLPNFLQHRLCDRFERSLDYCFWIEPNQTTTSGTNVTGTNVTWTFTNKGNDSSRG